MKDKYNGPIRVKERKKYLCPKCKKAFIAIEGDFGSYKTKLLEHVIDECPAKDQHEIGGNEE